MNAQARGGFQYFITFTDDFSRYGYIYLMRHKSEALEKFKEFKNEVQNQHDKSIKALRSDRGRVYLSQDFDELLKECGIVSQLTPPVQQQVIELEVEQTSQVVEKNSTNLETQPLRRSTRERHEPERYGFLVTTHGDGILIDQDEPKIYQEAVSSPDFEKWLEAMRFEMDSMSENQVWTLVEPPEGIKPIGCKWVFKKKTNMDGKVQTYKGRLVAKGQEAYIFRVKIYRDRSRRLLGLSQSTYIDKVLKRFSMEESKRGFLPMRHDISLSKEMCPSTPQERERMSQIPYALAIGSIIRFHLIREIIDREDVEICEVHTDDNIADPLTKPLAQQKHDRHTESLGIRYVSDWS
ncbi:hypothetical protein V6N13_064235 [Hibiscus sabdariffa]